MGEKENKRAFAFHLKTAEVPASMMRETVSRAVRESRVFKVREVFVCFND